MNLFTFLVARSARATSEGGSALCRNRDSQKKKYDHFAKEIRRELKPEICGFLGFNEYRSLKLT